MTSNTDYSIDQLASDGRELLQNRDGIDAHRSFNHWVNCVADWLDQQFPDSGKSATWSGLDASTLVSGRHFYDNPTAWQIFHKAVRERLSWLGQLSSAQASSGNSELSQCETLDIFVVHGHDNEFKQDVARTLTQLGLSPIILHERPNCGQTIIEKFERESDVGFAVILLSPDDVAYALNAKDKIKNRARQNVVLELGYFVGKLGRSRVCALKKGDLEVPSDFAGVVYTPFDANGGWRLALAQELLAAGYPIDLNDLVHS